MLFESAGRHTTSMTASTDSRQRMRRLLSRRPNGLAYDEIRAKFMDERNAALDLLILDEVRRGRVWVHKGRYFSRKQYERAVKS